MPTGSFYPAGFSLKPAFRKLIAKLIHAVTMSGLTSIIGLRLAKHLSDMENLPAASLASAVSATGTSGITDIRPSDSKTFPAKAGSAASEFKATLDNIGNWHSSKINEPVVIRKPLQTQSEIVRPGGSCGNVETDDWKAGIEEKTSPVSRVSQPARTKPPEQAVAISAALELKSDTKTPASHPKEMHSQDRRNPPGAEQDKKPGESQAIMTLAALPEVPLPVATPNLLSLPQPTPSLDARPFQQTGAKSGPATAEAKVEKSARGDPDATARTMHLIPVSPLLASALPSDAITSQETAAMQTTASASASPVASLAALHHAEAAAKPFSKAIAANSNESAAAVPAIAAAPLQANLSATSGGANIYAPRPAEAAVSANAIQAAVPQVTPALISLATRTDGGTEMTVSLNPHELGQVEIHMVRGIDGTTTVSIMASRPETLQELSQNVHHLHAALDAANVPPEGRTMNFMDTPVLSNQNSAPQGTPGSGGSVQAGDAQTGGTQAGNTEAGADGSGGRNQEQSHAWRHDRQDQTGGGQDGGAASHLPPGPFASRRTWQISSLNITA